MARLPAGIRRSELVELAGINEQIKTLDARKKEIVDKAKRAHAGLPADTYPYGPVVVLLKESRSFDGGAFAAEYPFTKSPSFYGRAIDASKVPLELRAGFTTVTRSFELKRAAGTKPAIK